MPRYAPFSRSNPLIGLVLATAGLLTMIFGGSKGLIAGSLLLWYIASVFLPALCGPFLCRQFGSALGMTIAFAPLWLPVLLVLSAKVWMPILGLH
jgi:hypothetical protein